MHSSAFESQIPASGHDRRPSTRDLIAMARAEAMSRGAPPVRPPMEAEPERRRRGFSIFALTASAGFLSTGLAGLATLVTA